jgi:hypothetical protein
MHRALPVSGEPAFPGPGRDADPIAGTELGLHGGDVILHGAGRDEQPRAELCVLLPLPSGLWRVALSLHVPVGWHHPIPWYASMYAIGLSVVVEALAFLTLGLVRSWGVVYPRRMPFLGGRPVPPAAAIVPAATGAVILTWMAAVVLTATDRGFYGNPEPGDPTGIASDLMIAAYAPLVLWGPLLAVATFGYWRRVRGAWSPRAATAG